MKAFLDAMTEENVDLKNLRIRGEKLKILESIAAVYGLSIQYD